MVIIAMAMQNAQKRSKNKNSNQQKSKNGYVKSTLNYKPPYKGSDNYNSIVNKQIDLEEAQHEIILQKISQQQEESKYTEAELEEMQQKKNDNYAKMIDKYKQKQQDKSYAPKKFGLQSEHSDVASIIQPQDIIQPKVNIQPSTIDLGDFDYVEIDEGQIQGLE